MKVRIKFQKYGAMKFIGHLDVMRYFQKAFRRANIDNELSKGFNPHQIMSFAAPLGVGLTSDGEYLDAQLLSSDDPDTMINRMNAVMTEGFRVIGFRHLLDPEENKKVITAMSLVASADYLVSLKDGYEIGNGFRIKEFQNAWLRFLSEKEIIVDKKTKTSEKAVDIRPMITLTAFREEEYKDKLKEVIRQESITVPASVAVVKEVKSVADVYENGIKVYLQLDTGSASNLKPELVMEAFYDYIGLPYEKYAWQVHRIETYTRDESGKLISLDRLER